MAGWDATRLPVLTGRTAVVTGANSGIGFHTARQLAAHGARVVLACRDVERAKQASDRIRADAEHAEVEVAELNLADMASVREFGERWEGPLHLLINNAGVMAPPRRARTRDGFELQFGTNHLGHFVLTGLLLPALLKAPSPRVVTVSSLAHFGGRRDDVLAGNATGAYSRQRAYCTSKLANLMFAMELHRQASTRQLPLTSTAAHPGLSATGLVSDPEGMGANPVLRILGSLFAKAFLQPASAGARPVLYGATIAASGSYTGPQRFGETRGRPGPARMSALAQDERLARRVWDLSVELTGFRYPWPKATA